MARDKQLIINEIARQQNILENIIGEINKTQNEIQDLFHFLEKYQTMISMAEEKQATQISKISSSPIKAEKSKIFIGYSGQMNEILTGSESNKVFQGIQTGLSEINQTIQKQEEKLDDLNQQKRRVEIQIDNLYHELNSINEDEQGEK